MQTEVDILLRAVDDASAVLSGAADKIRVSMGGVEGANVQLDQAQRKTDSSTRDLITGFSGMATGAFSLYMAVDHVEKSQVQLERANLMVKRANESVEASQNAYNAAVAKYGVNSQAAKDASDKLSIAQDAYAVATDRANLAQGNVNNAMMQGALMVIPTLITIVSSAKNALGGMEGAQKLLNTAMDANPIFLVIGAIAALVAILITAYYTIQPFRDAVDSLGRFLGLLPPAMSDAERETNRMAECMAFVTEQTRLAEEHYQSAIRAQDNFTNSVLDLGREVEGTNEILTRQCSTLRDYRQLENDASSAVLILQDSIKGLNTDMAATNAALNKEIENLSSSNNTLMGHADFTEHMTRAETEHYQAVAALNQQIVDNTNLTADQVAEIKKQILAIQEAEKRAKEMADYLVQLGESYSTMQATASPSIAYIANQWRDLVNSGSLAEAGQLAEAWGRQYGLTVGQAGTALEGFVADEDRAAQAARNLALAQQQALDSLATSIVQSYTVATNATDSFVAQINTFYRQAIAAGNTGDIERSLNLISLKYDVTYQQAAQMLDKYQVALDEATKKQNAALTEQAQNVDTHCTTVESEYDKFTAKVTHEFEVQKASAASNLDAVAVSFNSAYSAGNINQAISVITDFANAYGITFDEAEGVISKFTNTQKTELDKQQADVRKAAEAVSTAYWKLYDENVATEDARCAAIAAANAQLVVTMVGHADKIKSDYFDRVTSQSVDFKSNVVSLAQQMANSWHSMSEDTTLESMIITGRIQDFADQWGMTWDDAKAIITKAADGIDAEMSKIPQSIEQQLIGKAQDDFKAFQDCVTGKSRTLNTDVTGQMANLAGNITDLIHNGLVGEAQNEMQAYVDCNTNKTATMVTDINGMMAKLTTDYNAQLAAMTAEADSLTGEQKVAVLRNIDALTTAYEAKMAQLRAWQQQLLDSMVSDADRVFARMQAMVASIQAQADAAIAAGAAVSHTRIPVLAEAAPQASGPLTGPAPPTLSTVRASAYSGPSVSSLIAGIGASQAPNVSIQILAPLVNVEGSADQATASLAATLVQQSLNHVLVEPSSVSAPSIVKRIVAVQV